MSDHPIWAPYIWYDPRNLYLEFPSRPGQPAATLTFPLTEGGLAKALKQIRSNPIPADPRILGLAQVADKVLPLRPKVTKVRGKDQFDEGLRAATRDVLRRLKVGG